MHRSIVTVGVMMTAGLRVSVYADTVQGPCESTVLALPNPDPDYWDRFGHPKSYPSQSVGFPSVWWWNEAAANKLAEAK